MPAALVAILDDDPLYCAMMDLVLTKEGYRTLVLCPPGPDIREQIRTERPAVLVVDLNLQSWGDGMAVLNELWLDPVTAVIPVIVASADRSLSQRNGDFWRARG